MPALEKDAIESVMPVAPTVIAFSARAGLALQAGVASFPEATTTCGFTTFEVSFVTHAANVLHLQLW